MFNVISLKNGLENVAGFNFSGISMGLKKNGTNDLGFIYAPDGAKLWARFTSNTFKAAPIRHFYRTFGFDENTKSGKNLTSSDLKGKEFYTNFVLLNSKNANAMTGEAGINDICEIFKNLENSSNFKNVKLKNPLMSSTGVIGYPLPKSRILEFASKFDLNERNSDAVANSIMTTDRFKKEIALKVELENGQSFNVACICKGAGMINPQLATMLCFILTDAKVPNEDANELLDNAVNTSFNAISVDGDTSTNDTIMLLSSEKSGAYDKEAFKFALEKITLQMALNLAKDGEGSTKVVAFEVRGAKNDDEAQIVAKALSNSSLVKTAIFGCDPNWGRIASTIGASGVECAENTLSIYYDDVLVYDDTHKELDEKRESDAHAVMLKESYKITCNLGVANGSYTAYGCDLGHEYVSINADYRS